MPGPQGDAVAQLFSDYDKPVPSATPSPDRSVDIGKLQQRLQSS
ncbi:hypothetical protein ACWCQ1_31230 [Streptomyces sp. NPDC002144]